jgi:hypothetical protein
VRGGLLLRSLLSHGFAASATHLADDADRYQRQNHDGRSHHHALHDPRL